MVQKYKTPIKKTTMTINKHFYRQWSIKWFN